MSAEEKAKGIVFEWGDKAVSSLDPEDIPTLERSITAALLDAEARGRREALTEAADVTEKHGKKMACWCATEAAEMIRALPAPTEGEGEKRG